MDQARVYRFLEKTNKNRKKKSKIDDEPDDESHPATVEESHQTEDCDKMAQERDKLRKKVASLMKKQKMKKAIQIVKKHDDLKPWGQEGHVKVCYVSMLVPMNLEAIYLLLYYNAVVVNSRLAAA